MKYIEHPSYLIYHEKYDRYTYPIYYERDTYNHHVYISIHGNGDEYVSPLSTTISRIRLPSTYSHSLAHFFAISLPRVLWPKFSTSYVILRKIYQVFREYLFF